jgi:hypothetical protein
MNHLLGAAADTPEVSHAVAAMLLTRERWNSWRTGPRTSTSPAHNATKAT